MSEHKKRTATVLRLHAIAAALALCGGSAAAAELDTGNTDFKVRWDNTVRYNLGVRMEGQDPRILASTTYDESDAKFGKHDIVNNRLDLLSEFDLNYKNKYGLRVSAAAWYDHAYHNHTVTSPARGVTSYFGDQYNSKVKRYLNGPSGEFLDAFVWSNFNLGEAPVNVKLGRHAIIWGEALFLSTHAISYSQAPIDAVKLSGSPGAEIKETTLPLNQLSFKAQVTNDLTLAGQYFLEWKPTRAPNSGAFLTGADTAPNVDRLGITPTFAATNVAPVTPRNRGNWGLSARLNVDAIGSTVGAYYREFDDYNPETGIQFRSFVPGAPLPASFRFVYPKNTQLLGFSLARPIGPVSFGSEISYRKNAALNTVGSYSTVANNLETGARGDTVHALINGVYLLPKTALWETGALQAELAYSHLVKVTTNEQLFKGVGHVGCTKLNTGGVPAGTPGDESDACSSRDFMQAVVVFVPQYLGVLPSWDLSVPFSVSYGIKGVAPSGSGGFEKLLTWSIGANLTYQSKHEFSLRYADIIAPSKYNAAGTTLIGGGASGGSIGATDRGWLVLTYKTAF